jgi:membrane-bound lytic murein transglycosylase B
LHRHSSIRHTHITEEIRKTISTKEAEISNAITSIDTQLADVEGALRDVSLTDEQGQNEEDMRNAVKQIEEERAALGCSQKLLEELLSKTRDDVIARAASESQKRSTEVTFGNNNSGFQAGIINGPISGISFGGT